MDLLGDGKRDTVPVRAAFEDSYLTLRPATGDQSLAVQLAVSGGSLSQKLYDDLCVCVHARVLVLTCTHALKHTWWWSTTRDINDAMMITVQDVGGKCLLASLFVTVTRLTKWASSCSVLFFSLRLRFSLVVLAYSLALSFSFWHTHIGLLLWLYFSLPWVSCYLLEVSLESLAIRLALSFLLWLHAQMHCYLSFFAQPSPWSKFHPHTAVLKFIISRKTLILLLSLRPLSIIHTLFFPFLYVRDRHVVLFINFPRPHQESVRLSQPPRQAMTNVWFPWQQQSC